MGPSTEPWGTTCVWRRGFEHSDPIFTSLNLFYMYDLSKDSAFVRKPIANNLLISAS